MEKDYEKIVKELGEKLKRTPGFLTVGLGKNENDVVLVVFVDQRKLDKKKRPPKKFRDITVIVRPSEEAVLHGGLA